MKHKLQVWTVIPAFILGSLYAVSSTTHDGWSIYWLLGSFAIGTAYEPIRNLIDALKVSRRTK